MLITAKVPPRSRPATLPSTAQSFFINNFFVCLVASIVLQTQCAKHHDLDKDCKPNVDGHRDAYRAATEAVSSEQTLLGIATGIAQLLTCKLWGDTGDSFGRRAVLMFHVFT